MKTLLCWVVMGMVGMVGCNGAAPMGCDEDVDTAVLRTIAKHMGDYGKGGFSTYLNGDTKESLDAYQSKLRDLRSWAEAQPERCVRESYIHWIDYYQRELNASYDELRTHKERDEMNNYRAQRKAESDRIQRLLDANRVPVPPKH